MFEFAMDMGLGEVVPVGAQSPVSVALPTVAAVPSPPPHFSPEVVAKFQAAMEKPLADNALLQQALEAVVGEAKAAVVEEPMGDVEAPMVGCGVPSASVVVAAPVVEARIVAEATPVANPAVVEAAEPVVIAEPKPVAAADVKQIATEKAQTLAVTAPVIESTTERVVVTPKPAEVVGRGFPAAPSSREDPSKSVAADKPVAVAAPVVEAKIVVEATPVAMPAVVEAAEPVVIAEPKPVAAADVKQIATEETQTLAVTTPVVESTTERVVVTPEPAEVVGRGVPSAPSSTMLATVTAPVGEGVSAEKLFFEGSRRPSDGTAVAVKVPVVGEVATPVVDVETFSPVVDRQPSIVVREPVVPAEAVKPVVVDDGAKPVVSGAEGTPRPTTRVEVVDAPVVETEIVIADKPVADVAKPAVAITAPVVESTTERVESTPVAKPVVSDVAKPILDESDEIADPVIPQALPTVVADVIHQAVVVPEVAAAPVVSASIAAKVEAATAAEVLVEAASAVADTMLVSPGLMRGEGEIVIQLKPEVLAGTELKISVESGTMTVEFSPSVEKIATLLTQNQGSLIEVLSERVGRYNIVVNVRPTHVKGLRYGRV